MKFKLIALLMLVIFAAGCEPEVKIVSVEPTTTSFTASGQSTAVKAVALELNGNPLPGIPMTYRSDNTAVAEVTGDGVITPVASGSAIITISSPNGKQAQTFVKVCLPKEIICDPANTLKLRVGTAAPLKCHITDCKGEKIAGVVPSLAGFDKESVFKDGPHTFVGKKVGTTSIKVSSGDLEKVVNVVIAEQIFAPGMEPGRGGGGHGGGGVDKNKDPYGDKGHGQFNHIMKNMKF